ncbi:MAG: carboxypeptidase-like regulatory domain-containing protein, partial [Muribaculaceae bacterium]
MKKALAMFAALCLAVGAPYSGESDWNVGFVAHAQGNAVSGVVKDSKGEPLIGATVMVKGTQRGVSTDVSGRYTIQAAAGNVLQISYVGMKTKTVKVAGSKTIDVTLEGTDTELEDLVVVGYGQQKKINLTGAVSSVDVEKTLQGRQIPDVGRGLQGTTPGLNVVLPNGEIGSDPTIKIRGQFASFQGSTQPLILMDNVEIPSIQIVNPDDVESISVLKDAAAASIYGSKAAFGVILITTKKGAKTESVNVSYSANFAWQNISKKMEMGGIDALQYRVDAMKRVGSTLYGAFWYVDEESLAAARQWQADYGGKIGKDDPFVYGRDWYVNEKGQKFSKRIFDPYDYMIREWAPSMTHNLSVNGKSGKTSYNIGLGYLDQAGLIAPSKHDDFRRYNASVRLSTEINKYVTVHAGLTYSMR